MVAATDQFCLALTQDSQNCHFSERVLRHFYLRPQRRDPNLLRAAFELSRQRRNRRDLPQDAAK